MKQDLLNAFRIIKDYCQSIENCCDCEIQDQCNEARFKQEVPASWKLEEDEGFEIWSKSYEGTSIKIEVDGIEHDVVFSTKEEEQ